MPKINLASTRLAFFLIALLLLLVAVSAVIPQRDLAEGQLLDWKAKLGSSYVVIEKLGLDRIYYSPFFFAVLGLLAINLATGTVKRFRNVYRLEGSLLKARHLGSIVFHLSLLLVLITAILNYLYKSEVVFALTEGQLVQDDPGQYFREFNGPLLDPQMDRFSLSLDSLTVLPMQIGPPEAVASITVDHAAKSAAMAVVGTNRPLVWEGLEFHVGSQAGYSPEIVWVDSSGNTVLQSFVRLARTRHGEEWVDRDYVVLSELDMKLEIEVISDPGGIDSTLILLALFGNSELLIQDTVTTADTVTFGGYKLSVPRLRRWCYIDVVDNPYLVLVFAGFWSALVGMTLGLVGRIWPKARVR